MPTRLIERIIEIIRKNETFFITSHENPDGDSIACETAIALFLEFLGKKNYTIVNRDGAPGVYQFLPRARKIRKAEKVSGTFDVALIVDSSDKKRTGNIIDLDRQAGTVIVIDHHLSAVPFGDFNFLDTHSASCAELIYKVIISGMKKITPQIAACLYAGVMTETNRFQEANTTVEAFSVAAELVAAGANPNFLARKIYEENKFVQMRLLSAALATLRLECAGAVTVMEVTRAMMKRTGAVKENTEGFINYARSIERVKIALLFREHNDGVKVSLRSKNKTDVNKIAVHFGGGGHRRAAGFFLPGKLSEVKQQVIEYVEEQLKK